jgi:hypothetical protein
VIEAAMAKARQLANLKQGDISPVKESFLDGGQTRVKIGAYVGVSGNHVYRERKAV